MRARFIHIIVLSNLYLYISGILPASHASHHSRSGQVAHQTTFGGLLVTMSGTQWPRVLDLSEDDARKALRTLELNTYSSLLATFRAQGDLSPQKKDMLKQLQSMLG